MGKNLIIIALVAALAAGAYMYEKEKNTTTIEFGGSKIQIEK